MKERSNKSKDSHVLLHASVCPMTTQTIYFMFEITKVSQTCSLKRNNSCYLLYNTYVFVVSSKHIGVSVKPCNPAWRCQRIISSRRCFTGHAWQAAVSCAVYRIEL